MQAVQSKILEDFEKITHLMPQTILDTHKSYDRQQAQIIQFQSDSLASHREMSGEMRTIQNQFQWMQKTLDALLQTPTLNSELKLVREAHTKELARLNKEREDLMRDNATARKASESVRSINDMQSRKILELEACLAAKDAQLLALQKQIKEQAEAAAKPRLLFPPALPRKPAVEAKPEPPSHWSNPPSITPQEFKRKHGYG
jgi:hypothetical protein